MNGVELLSRVKYLFPDVVRILITGHADVELATKAVNKGSIFKFLVKPCSNDLLRSTVQQAFRYFDIQNEQGKISGEFHDVSNTEDEVAGYSDKVMSVKIPDKAKKRWRMVK